MKSYNIPMECFEDREYDNMRRRLHMVYVKQYDGNFKRCRLAHIRAGNIFKVNGVEYRANKDSEYDNIRRVVMIHASIYKDYIDSMNQTSYEFEIPGDNLCRE